MSRRPSVPSVSHHARHDVNQAFEPFLACYENISTIVTPSGRLHNIQFALDGLAALALFARSKEQEFRIHLPTLEALTMQLEEHIEIVLHTVPEYAYALQQAVAEVSGSPKSEEWKYCKQIYTLDFRALGTSRFSEVAATPVELNLNTGPARVITVAHPSYLVFSAFERIVSAPHPAKSDLTLLVAIYWFEEVAILEPGTFFDPEKIKQSASTSSFEQLGQDVTDKMETEGVLTQIMTISRDLFGRSIGEFDFLNMIQNVSRKASIPHHPGIPVNEADEYYKHHPVPPPSKEFYVTSRPKRPILFTGTSWFKPSTRAINDDEEFSPTAPRKPSLRRTNTNVPSSTSPDEAPLTRSRSAHALSQWGEGLRKLSMKSTRQGSEGGQGGSGGNRRRT